MSAYFCLPATTLQGSSEEYRLKGIQGLKCPPTQSPTSVYNPVHAPMQADLNAVRWLRYCFKAGEKEASIDNYSEVNPSLLPDLPLSLPKLVLATTKPISTADLKKYKLRAYQAGRTKYKNVYTLTETTTVEKIRAIKSELEDGYIAPSGFCTPKSANAFVVVRKLVSAQMATLVAAPEESGSNPGFAKGLPSYTYKEIVYQTMAEGSEETFMSYQLPKGGAVMGITPAQIPKLPGRGYIFFPYFKGSIGSDKIAIRDLLVQIAPAFSKDSTKSLQVINSLLSVADKALEGEHGRVVAHLAHCCNLMQKAGLVGYSICPGREYVGVVAIGPSRTVFSDHYGITHSSVSWDDVLEQVNAASTGLIALEKLAAVLSDLEVHEDFQDEDAEMEDEKVVVKPEDLSCSYLIWYAILERWEAFGRNESTKKSILELLTHLDFSEDSRREFTPEGLKDFLYWIRDEETPYDKKAGAGRYMNLAGIDLSTDASVAAHGLFGGISYSPVWPGGKKMIIPAPGAPDPLRKAREVLVKKGDKMEKTMMVTMEHLVFTRCTPLQAKKDWEMVREAGAIWQPEKTLTRKEKLGNVVWTGDSLELGWETLKQYFHKPGKDATSSKKAKTDKKEDKKVEVEHVDITGLSGW